MFGNFKRAKDIKGVNEFVKTLHPMFQFRQLQEDRYGHRSKRLIDCICPEGMKRIDDMQNLFSIRVDLSDPDCLARLKDAYSYDGVFVYQELLDIISFLSSEWQRTIRTWSEFKLNISFSSNDWEAQRLTHVPPPRATYQLYVEVSSPTCLFERFRATITRDRANYEYLADITTSWRAETPVTVDGMKNLLTHFIDTRKPKYDAIYNDALGLASKLQSVPVSKLADTLVLNGRVYSALLRRFRV